MLYAAFTPVRYGEHMDLTFSLRPQSRRWRQRERNVAPSALPLLFARLAAYEGVSVTAGLQAKLGRNGTTASPLEQRITILTGGAAGWTCPTCASFADVAVDDNDAATFVKPAFTLALQRSFKCATVQAGAAEHTGAPALVSRPR